MEVSLYQIVHNPHYVVVISDIAIIYENNYRHPSNELSMKWYKYDIRDLGDTEYGKWYSLMSEDKQQRVDRF